MYYVKYVACLLFVLRSQLDDTPIEYTPQHEKNAVRPQPSGSQSAPCELRTSGSELCQRNCDVQPLLRADTPWNYICGADEGGASPQLLLLLPLADLASYRVVWEDGR